MGSPQFMTVCFAIALILGTFLVIAVRERRAKKRLIARLRAEFGRETPRARDAETFESISHYALEHSGDGFYIDDITWNDLGMDDLFRRIAVVQSSPGEDVLYAMLRLPERREDVLLERERLIRYFSENEEERVRLQYILARVGRLRRMSHYDYICALDDVKPLNTALYAGLMVLGILNIALFFIKPVVAVALFVILMTVNSSIRLRNNEIAVWAKSFNAVLSLISAADEVRKLEIPAIAVICDGLKEATEAFSHFRRGAFLVATAGQMGTGLGDTVLEYLKMFFHIDKLKFNQMLHAYRGHRKEADDLVRLLGTIDALIAAASLRISLPYYTVPQFAMDGEEDGGRAVLSAEELYHPLIAEPVANSFTMTGGNLITGSNASGKSTFLKSCAIAAILAQSIHTVPAKRYRASLFKIMSSMALTDNLAAKESYFVVELKSIRRILAESKKGEMLFCLVDEVLRGTNTVERIAASARILKELAESPCTLALAATHDIELTRILQGIYVNRHFEETVTEEDVTFDYTLKDGPAMTRNAIRLLKVMAFDPPIVRDAGEMAAHFDRTGTWYELKGNAGFEG